MAGRDMAMMMDDQAQVLDALFHQIVLEEADNLTYQTAAFAVALRAQAQCRAV